MRRRHLLAALAALALQLPTASDLIAQTTASLEVGASTIHYETFLRSGAAYAVPMIQFEAPGVSLGARANYVVFESGNQILQGLLAGGAFTRLGERVRLEVSGSAGLASYADEPEYGHVLGRARVHLTGIGDGVWVGAGTGQSFLGAASDAAYEIGAGLWAVRSAWTLGASATYVGVEDLGLVDVTGTARWVGRRLEVDGAATARAGDSAAGPGVFGEVALRVLLSPRVAVTASGGRYPSDPARAGLGASYASIGLRLATARPRRVVSAELRDVLARTFEDTRRTGAADVRLLVAAGSEDRRITIVAPGARAVEIRGDFTDWETVALSRVDETTFEVPGTVPPGVYRLVVRVDGGSWIAPGGTRSEEGEFGGRVGVVVVPGR